MSTEIQTFVDDGLIGQNDQLWNSTSQSYENFPISSQIVPQQQPVQDPATQVLAQQPAQPPGQTIIVNQQQSGTATTAGWILFALGLISQITVIGLMISPLFYLISFILSIVMMCQGRAVNGIILLIVNLVVPTILGLIQFIVIGVSLGG